MKENHSREPSLTPAEQELMARLREHPELMERVQSILAITCQPDGPIKRAAEVEGLLAEEMRRLGNTSLASWAARTERRLAGELRQKDGSARARKKKR